MARTCRPGRFIATALLVAPLLIAADKPGSKPAKPEKAFKLPAKWVVLVNPAIRIRGLRPLPEQGLVHNFQDLRFTGPKPGHPFVLGDFIDDGDFALVDGALQLATGSNGALQLPEAHQFELEGIMEHEAAGGWFLGVGWGDGRGYVLSNVTMKESGSPWFLTELRGGSAIPDGTQDLDHFEWLRSQPFRLSVKSSELTLEVGKRAVVDHLPIMNYQKGHVLLGVYNTRYGPKKLKIHSLRMRSLDEPEDARKK